MVDSRRVALTSPQLLALAGPPEQKFHIAVAAGIVYVYSLATSVERGVVVLENVDSHILPVVEL